LKIEAALFFFYTAAVFAHPQPTPAIQTAEHVPQQAATNTAAAATKATLYVYRLHAMRGAFNKVSIYVDDQEFARMGNGSFIGVNLDPGRHVVRSDEKASAVAVEMESGRVYYVRLAFEQTRATYRAETELVPAELGWSELGQTKPNDSKNIKNHELVLVDSMPPKPAPAQESADQCRSLAVTRAMGTTGQLPPPGQLVNLQVGFKVVDVVNYPGAFVGKWYPEAAFKALQSEQSLHSVVLEKGYTPEDVARARSFCQSGTKEPEPAK
jgi:hypothetical protein